VTFSEDIQHQMRQVLRLQAGDEVVVMDGGSYEYHCILVTDAGKFYGEAGEKTLNKSESGTIIALNFPLSWREKLEWIL